MIRPFGALKFGRSLMLHAPLEYEMIMTATGGGPPDVDLIEAVGYASINPYFQSTVFRRFLIRYRKCGCTQDRSLKPPTAEMKMRALERRRKKMYGM